MFNKLNILNYNFSENIVIGSVVNNEFVESKSNKTMDVINPATGEKN